MARTIIIINIDIDNCHVSQEVLESGDADCASNATAWDGSCRGTLTPGLAACIERDLANRRECQQDLMITIYNAGLISRWPCAAMAGGRPGSVLGPA